MSCSEQKGTLGAELPRPCGLKGSNMLTYLLVPVPRCIGICVQDIVSIRAAENKNKREVQDYIDLAFEGSASARKSYSSERIHGHKLAHSTAKPA